ncbi:hypothetical protein [Gluconacetobacter diazotrophicus]|uniref:hypothetical protein n=1 Tax=Gluconacetobacter diazotrophicus TaxID=33996 RepID=UPI0011A70671|nr:hypothetical protein [Gluconacetobacter diazotrophicus]
MTCWLAIIIALRACRDCTGRGWIRTVWSGGRDLFVFRTVQSLAICPVCDGDGRQAWARGGPLPRPGQQRRRPAVRDERRAAA